MPQEQGLRIDSQTAQDEQRQHGPGDPEQRLAVVLDEEAVDDHLHHVDERPGGRRRFRHRNERAENRPEVATDMVAEEPLHQGERRGPSRPGFRQIGQG